MEYPGDLLERNLYGHPPAGLLWERQVGKVLSEHGWGKVPNWECLFVNRAKRTILVCACGRYKNGQAKNRKHETDLEISDERR